MLAPLTLLALCALQELPTVLVERGQPLAGLPATTTLASELTFHSTPRAGFVMGAFVRDAAGNGRVTAWGNPVSGPYGPLPLSPTGPATINYAPGFRGFPLSDGELVWGPYGGSTSPCQGYPTMYRGDDAILCLDDPAFYPGGVVADDVLDARSREDGSLLAYVRYKEPLVPGDPTFREIRQGPLLGGVLGRGNVISGVGPIMDVDRARLDPRGRSFGAMALVDDFGTMRRVAVVDGVAPSFPAGSAFGEFVEAGSLVEPTTANTERWVQVNEAWWDPRGGWYAIGLTDAPSAMRRVIVRDHEVVQRKGDTLDGRVLDACLGMAVAPRGELLTLWDVAPGADYRLALFVDGRVALEEGDTVDVDGDGTADAGHTVFALQSSFPFGGSLDSYNDLDEDRVLRSLVWLEHPVARNGFAIVERQIPMGDEICMGEPNSTGVAARMGARGSTYLGGSGLTLTVDGLPPATVGIVVVSRDAGLTLGAGGGLGTLCLGGAIGRVVGPGGIPFAADAAGHLEASVDLAALAQPTGPVVVQPGETWLFQCWYRDVTAQGAPTSNLSGALALEFR